MALTQKKKKLPTNLRYSCVQYTHTLLFSCLTNWHREIVPLCSLQQLRTQSRCEMRACTHTVRAKSAQWTTQDNVCFLSSSHIAHGMHMSGRGLGTSCPLSQDKTTISLLHWEFCNFPCKSFLFRWQKWRDEWSTLFPYVEQRKCKYFPCEICWSGNFLRRPVLKGQLWKCERTKEN